MKQTHKQVVKEEQKSDTQKTQLRRATLFGKVVSAKNAQTIIVSVSRVVTHPFYGKQLRRTKRIPTHVAQGEFSVGDKVKIAPSRPVSKTKHYTVIEKLG